MCGEYTPRHHLRLIISIIAYRKEASMQKLVKLVKKGCFTRAPRFHQRRENVTTIIALFVLISLQITALLVGTNHALAAPIFTSSDQDQSITSFVSAFYDPNNHFFFTDTQNHAEADLGKEAIDWDII